MTIDIGKQFMEKTKYSNMQPADQARGLPQPPVELDIPGIAAIIDLPSAQDFQPAEISITQAIAERVSVRKYAEQALSLAELSYLLWCTQGVKSIEPHLVTLRTVPSAGARHAFETYILINRVSGLVPGLYKFLAIDHQLAKIDTGDSSMSEVITAACLGQSFVRQSAVTFIWTAAVYRMAYRYGQRGYRYLHIDAGHVCQNLYLAAGAIHSGVCAIAAFDDDKLNAALRLDGENQFAIYVATVGKKP